MRPSATRRPRQPRPNIRAIHSTFTGIYALLAAAVLVSPVIFVRYEIVFQMGLLGFLIGIAFLMISAVMWGKELCHCHGEFYILHRHTIAIIYCSGAAALFTFFYIWSIANSLLRCPNFEANMSPETLLNQTQITISVSYVAPDRGILRRQSLRIKYDTQQKQLVREQTDNAADEVISVLKSQSVGEDRTEALHQKQREWLHAAQDNEELDFKMLQNEIGFLLAEASVPYKAAEAASSQRSIVPLHTTNVEEDEKFQEDRAAKICRNEKGMAVFLLFMLVLCEILYLATIVVYLWLRSWTTVLCPPRVISRRHAAGCSLQ